MTAPLNRDQQIELMKGAQARHRARMRDWISHRAVREVICRPAPGQAEDEPHYTCRDRQVACTG